MAGVRRDVRRRMVGGMEICYEADVRKDVKRD